MVAALSGCCACAAQAIELTELSLTPAHACNAPPRAPPTKLLNKDYPGFSTGGNAPFRHDVDINGDGWCDWVSTAALSPHRDPYLWDEPLLKDFIYIGTKKGWRRFGNHQHIVAVRSRGKLGAHQVYGPDEDVADLIDPTFVYATGSSLPFVSAISLGQDILDAYPDNIWVYQWDKGLDALLVVAPREREIVIAFLRQQLCTDQKPTDGTSPIADAACREVKQ